MAQPTFSIRINNKPYAVAQEPDAYKVTEVPSHFDIDPRMERRAIYDRFGAGILKKRDEKPVDLTQISPYIRDSKVGDGIWWGNGTAVQGQRVFPQQATGTSTVMDIYSIPKFIGDGSLKSYFACRQHVLTFGPSTILAGVQQFVLSKSFTSINGWVADVASFAGKVWVAVCDTDGFSNPNLGSPQAMWAWTQATASTVWTQLTSPPPAGFPTYSVGDTGSATAFCVIRTQLWRASGSNMYSWDGLASAWSGVSVIGDPNTNITALDVYRDGLIIFKQDGIYSMDRVGSVYPLFPGFRTLGFNPRPLGQWRGAYYFASDVGMVWQWDGTTVTSVGFDLAEPYPMNSGVLGIPNAVTRGVALPNLFIVGFTQYNRPDPGAYFLAFNGDGWLPYQFLSGVTAQAVGITGGNVTPVAPTLQLGASLGTTGSIKYLAAPQIDPYLATAFDTTTQTLFLPIDGGVIDDQVKNLERIVVVVDNATKGTIGMYYSMDEDILNQVWTSLGTPQDANFTVQTFLPPTPFPSYHKLGMKITMTATTATSPIILRSIVLHYKQRGPLRRVWEIDLVVEQGVIGAFGAIDKRRTAQLIKDLYTARRSHSLVAFVDLFGTKIASGVYVEEVSQALKVRRAPGQGDSYIVKVKLVEPVLIDDGG